MTSRYGYAEDGNTAWCVVDYERGGATVSRHHMEQDACAEAARLNYNAAVAEAVAKRLAPQREVARLNAAAGKRAAPVTAWAKVSHGEIKPTTVHWSRHEVAADISAFLGDRIARVRIEEISDDE